MWTTTSTPSHVPGTAGFAPSGRRSDPLGTHSPPDRRRGESMLSTQCPAGMISRPPRLPPRWIDESPDRGIPPQLRKSAPLHRSPSSSITSTELLVCGLLRRWDRPFVYSANSAFGLQLREQAADARSPEESTVSAPARADLYPRFARSPGYRPGRQGDDVIDSHGKPVGRPLSGLTARVGRHCIRSRRRSRW